MASRNDSYHDLRPRVLELVKQGGLSVEDMADLIYTDEDGGPDFSLNCVRQSIYRLRKAGHMISNKPDRYWTGKTGKGNKARYYYAEEANAIVHRPS